MAANGKNMLMHVVMVKQVLIATVLGTTHVVTKPANKMGSGEHPNSQFGIHGF